MKKRMQVAALLLSLILLLTACQRRNTSDMGGGSTAFHEAETEKQANLTESQMQEPESLLSREKEITDMEESAAAEETLEPTYDSVVGTSMEVAETIFPEEKRVTEFAYHAYGQDPLAGYGVFSKGLLETDPLKTQLEIICDLARMNEVLEDMAKYVPTAPERYGSSIYQSLSCPDDGIQVVPQADYLQARRERYNEWFFEGRVLMLAMVITPCTGYTGGIAEIARNGSVLEIILTETSETSSMDEAIDRYYYCLEIPKEMLEGCERLTVRNEVYYMDSGRGGGSRTDSFSLKELMENQT